MKLSEAQKELVEAYKKTGWTLEWKYYIDPKQQHCFWHGGEYAVASRSYCGHEWEFSFGVYGDVIGTLFDKDWIEELAEVRDKANAAERDDIKIYIHTDKQLEKVLDNGRLELEDNNWPEMVLYCDGEPAEVCGVIYDGDDIIDAVWKPEELCDYLDENYIEEA